jgi:hypothetical protein
VTESREWHAEIEGTAPFPLPDELVLPNGRHLSGAKARIYHLLKRTATEGQRHRIGAEIGPAGWVPNYYLTKAWSGGHAGDRRLRDLRVLGVGIEQGVFESDRRGATKTFLYRWTGDPGEKHVSHPGRDSRPRATGGFSGRFLTESRSSVPVTRREAPGGLQFWTCVGFPGEDAPGRVDLAPHARHPLALEGWLFCRVAEGVAPAPWALERYRSLLRQRAEAVKRFVAGGGEHVLWVSMEHAETLDSLAVVAQAIVEAGGTFLGSWQRRESA